jgi:hypothetical protein
MFGISPFEVPVLPTTQQRQNREPLFPIDREPVFELTGWRRTAAIAFAAAPALVFLAVVTLHMLTQA